MVAIYLHFRNFSIVKFQDSMTSGKTAKMFM